MSRGKRYVAKRFYTTRKPLFCRLSLHVHENSHPEHRCSDLSSYAEIATSRRAAGHPISQFDAMIAAIARSRGASLATRNIKDFADCGIELIDPWAFDQR